MAVAGFRSNRSFGIGGRMAIVGGFGAAVATVAFTLLLGAIGDLRTAARLSNDGQTLLIAAGKLDSLTLELHAGQRGFLLTGDTAFRRSYDEAAAGLDEAIGELESLAAGDRAQAETARAVGAAARSYNEQWAQPQIRLAERDLAAARRRVLTGEGERRVATIRFYLRQIERREGAVTAARAHEAEEAGQHAVVTVGAAIGVLLALVVAAVGYFILVVVEPLRRLDVAARKWAAGDLDAVVEPTGAGEARTLIGSFNLMAVALRQDVQELGRQYAELEAVLDSTTDGITMTRSDGSILLSNARMEQFSREFGTNSVDGIWSRLATLAQRTHSPEEHLEAFARAAQDEELVYESAFVLPELGRSFQGYTGPVREADGSVLGRLFTLRETTAERAAESAKEQFLATVSHELRTPLTSIIGYLELILDGDAGELTPDQDRFLVVIDRSARQLHALVDDLLAVGRADAGTLELELDEVELDEIVLESGEAAQAEARQKGVELLVVAEPGLRLSGDRRRLSQLATNLIANAVKFTPAGGRVDVRVEAAAGRAILEVEDTGIGIPAGEQERLFERFFRASTARTAQVQGTGLGLAIAKAIVDAHGGTIEVQSREGTGTTFRVELPQEAGR